MGLIWGGPYRSAQLKFMWGPYGVSHFCSYGLTNMGPLGVSHMGPCVETHVGLPGLILCVAHIGYTLWDCPLGSHTELMWGSPYWHAQLKLTWVPLTHVTWLVTYFIWFAILRLLCIFCKHSRVCILCTDFYRGGNVNPLCDLFSFIQFTNGIC